MSLFFVQKILHIIKLLHDKILVVPTKIHQDRCVTIISSALNRQELRFNKFKIPAYNVSVYQASIISGNRLFVNVMHILRITERFG